MSIPLSIAKYIRSLLIAELILTYLHIDRAGRLKHWGGHPRHYGLHGLIAGEPACEQISFLEGLLPVAHTQLLEFVSVSTGCSAHVHLIPSHDGTWVLMFDATAEHDRRQKLQQQYNDLSMLSYRQSQMLQELENARQRLLDEKQQLESVASLQNSFIAQLSRDLRNLPDASVASQQLLAQATAIDVQEAARLATARSNTGKVLGLIDDLLAEIGRENERIILKPSPCQIRQLLHDLEKLFGPSARNKGLSFRIEAAAELPEHVVVDEFRLRQIFINLLSNALKFTAVGEVLLQASWHQGRFEFKVQDTGPGIAPEILQQLFQTHTHADTANAAGMSLRISVRLIRQMGGELLANSQAGQGTLFQGYVPAGLLPDKQPFLTSPTTQPKRPITVLLAEDNPGIRMLMALYLKDEGYQVIAADNGQDAIHLALSHQPDVILMDLQMPGMDGFAATERLRQTHQFNKPVIALSASTLMQDKKQALAAGCSGYLIKPVDAQDLLTSITQALQGF